MGLTSALYTGLTGLNANQIRIDTIGNNVANVNTTAYKASRAMFQTQFSQNFSLGTAPSDASGGTNPTQVGLGTTLGAIQRNFSPGSIETTGIPSDVAIEGDGLFIVRKGGGETAFTRDGSFSLNSAHQLVTADGHFVQGFGVDSAFNIVPGILTDVTVPLGELTVARQTQTASMEGTLSSDGTLATQGSMHVSQALVNGGGGPADAATLLTDLRDAAAPGSLLFADGNTITVSRVAKGDRELPTATFVVGTTGSTLGDFANWLNGALGINTTAGLPGTPGATVESGTLVIRGNAGLDNDFEITPNDFASDNPAAALPFAFTKTADANGSGVFTGFTVFDSLGAPVTVNLTLALESTPSTGPVWRFYAETPDSATGSRLLGTGTLTFDNEGNFVAATGNQIAIDRSATGATTPLAFTIDFSRLQGLAATNSNVILGEQDGYPPGTLTTYAVGVDGVLSGTFSNGLSRTLGQVALARFSNPEGLIAEADNLFVTGPNSGNPTITTPGLLGTGRVLGGALELSNVDLSREFIGLITSSTGFQANSRVISVTSDLLNQLLLIAR